MSRMIRTDVESSHAARAMFNQRPARTFHGNLLRSEKNRFQADGSTGCRASAETLGVATEEFTERGGIPESCGGADSAAIVRD
jgi:hypothetical protein